MGSARGQPVALGEEVGVGGGGCLVDRRNQRCVQRGALPASVAYAFELLDIEVELRDPLAAARGNAMPQVQRLGAQRGVAFHLIQHAAVVSRPVVGQLPEPPLQQRELEAGKVTVQRVTAGAQGVHG
ncbi:hypothetical protein D3C86_1442610 [compost metagenome]